MEEEVMAVVMVMVVVKTAVVFAGYCYAAVGCRGVRSLARSLARSFVRSFARSVFVRSFVRTAVDAAAIGMFTRVLEHGLVFGLKRGWVGE